MAKAKRVVKEIKEPEVSKEAQIELYKQIFLTLSTSLEKFAEVICSDAVTFNIADFHKEIYEVLGSNDRAVVAAPRGHAKSTIVSKIYPLWCALFKRRKDICIISDSESLAVEHLRYIKMSLESNQKILSLWGDLKSEKWTENHIIVRHRDGFTTNIRAKGAGGQMRGFRPDCLILDDIENDTEVVSEEQREKLKNWLFKACINTLLPGGQLFLIGTILHPLCVLKELLDSDNGWFKKCYTAYVDGIEDESHVLWPEMWSHEKLQARKKDIGSFAFYSEYMNNPRLNATGSIKMDQIRYWESLPDTLGISIAVDPAYCEDEKADYKVCAVVGADTEGRRFLIEYIRTHAPLSDFIDSILNLYIKYKAHVTGVGIPSAGTEQAFLKSFMERSEKRRLYPPVVELKNSFVNATGRKILNKTQRIVASLQPLFERGQYFIGKGQTEVVNELIDLGSSRWDDIVDCLCYAEQIIQPIWADVNTDEGSYKFDETQVVDYGMAY
jgi:phage terminase large subunit-like protein